MTDPQHDDDRMALARAVMEQYLAEGIALVQELVTSCRQQDGEVGARIVKAIYDRGDINLLMMVIGQLTTRLVATQDRADRAHGPLVTAAEMGREDTEPRPWQVSVYDQIDAAMRANDMPAVARILVDGQIHSALMDIDAGNGVDFEYCVRCMMLVDQKMLVIAAAEMMARLAAQEYQARESGR